jgi:hypothetical protein
VLTRLDADLLAIAALTVRANRTEAGWAAVESDDMFERGLDVGGFDADERAFTFSVYADDGELWVQYTPDEARAIVAGRLSGVRARPAELKQVRAHSPEGEQYPEVVAIVE